MNMIRASATMVQNLNQDLAAEYQAVIMYNTYASSVLGDHCQQLTIFFRDKAPDVLRHAEYLVNKIVSLGRIPTTQPADVPHAEDAGQIALANDLEEMIGDETRHMEECAKILFGFSSDT